MPLIRILKEASEELEAAASYFELERPGGGARFLEAYQAKLWQLEHFPRSGPLIEALSPGQQLRAFVIPRFRHMIVAGQFDGVLTIVAVAHTSRAPHYWRRRVP